MKKWALYESQRDYMSRNVILLRSLINIFTGRILDSQGYNRFLNRTTKTDKITWMSRLIWRTIVWLIMWYQNSEGIRELKENPCRTCRTWCVRIPILTESNDLQPDRKDPAHADLGFRCLHII